VELRFLTHSAKDAFSNMAVDEAIARNIERTGKPTVRFYSWKPSAVSIGYFQEIKHEVDLKECRKQGVDVVRRLTGGGAVFHDAELTYSFCCSAESRLVPDRILDSYEKICGALVNGFNELGLNAEFAPLNDIIVGGKKVSGNAQTRRWGAVLQHGTILLSVDPERMFSLLKVPDEKMKDKLVKTVKERVTSVEQELGKEAGFEAVSKAMKKGFEKQFQAKLTEGKLSKEEKELAEKARSERFSSEEWNSE